MATRVQRSRMTAEQLEQQRIAHRAYMRQWAAQRRARETTEEHDLRVAKQRERRRASDRRRLAEATAEELAERREHQRDYAPRRRRERQIGAAFTRIDEVVDEPERRLCVCGELVLVASLTGTDGHAAGPP